MNIDKKIESLKKQLREAEEEKQDQRRKIRFDCIGCGGRHMLGACEAILPHMATGDDGEYDRGAFEIVCPKTNMRNRVLFFGSNKHIAEDEFYSTYKRLFKNLVEVYGLSNKDSNWKNNMYFDQNRKKFGLTENKDAA